MAPLTRSGVRGHERLVCARVGQRVNVNYVLGGNERVAVEHVKVFFAEQEQAFDGVKAGDARTSINLIYFFAVLEQTRYQIVIVRCRHIICLIDRFVND
ncbi:hypothetical protein BpHYR1_006005 [Brachionus plicatilis]|uniref:Uncharacterized protein n=1 Tax=Brachionus plicatilis TaxID=10195 RepID=A0A3M7SWK5_BRAPC|nr:hypothetical protein BpHYR1_006005 [Brachionus plicatilis]